MKSLLNSWIQLWLLGTDKQDWISGNVSMTEFLCVWLDIFCRSISCNMQNPSHFSKMWLSFPLQIQASWWNWISAWLKCWRWYHITNLQIIAWLPAMHCVCLPQNRDGNSDYQLDGWLISTSSVRLLFQDWKSGPACKATGQGSFWSLPGCIQLYGYSHINSGNSLPLLISAILTSLPFKSNQ